MSEPSTRVVVAVDGPSGSGKSSASRRVASELGLRYLDTGAMYRAVTWWMQQNGVDVNDAVAVAARADVPRIVPGTDPTAPTISVDGVDVSTQIRELAVTHAASAVSAVPAVRARLLTIQHEVIGDGGIVVEGRDIGSTVAPDADVKVFLTARADVRAERRSAERLGTDQVPEAERKRAEAAMAKRDAHDSGREASPLTQAEDAVEIDATDLTLDEVVARIVAMVQTAADREVTQ